MEISEAIRSMCAEKNISQSALARRIGVTQPAISSLLSIGNPQLKPLLRLLGELGYNLAAVPKGSTLPEGAYELNTKSERDLSLKMRT